MQVEASYGLVQLAEIKVSTSKTQEETLDIISQPVELKPQLIKLGNKVKCKANLRSVELCA